MISNDLLKVLVCPESQAPLALAPDELIARLNARIAKGDLKNRAGQTLGRPLEGGLVREDGCVLYPILDDIPMMLIDEAIELTPGSNES